MHAAPHWTCEAFGCGVDLTSRELLEGMLLRAAELAGATVVADATHAYHGGGLTIVVLCAESHLLISTWPEADYALVEVFLCGPNPRPKSAVDHMRETLQAKEWRVHQAAVNVPDAKHVQGSKELALEVPSPRGA